MISFTIENELKSITAIVAPFAELFLQNIVTFKLNVKFKSI